ncbi:hypothetical protein AXFE_16260 [Acidithrix ferrooxidans]|uniref:Uncharacterized protein n=1 Tax=Acidithrix ferrooxidans TaxID=1280514 RepID=A0A0D8HIB6_9ACTN|nr:hypothetical protein AXFE_16260 [Acidithrix ferrooxidans]
MSKGASLKSSFIQHQPNFSTKTASTSSKFPTVWAYPKSHHVINALKWIGFSDAPFNIDSHLKKLSPLPAVPLEWPKRGSI